MITESTFTLSAESVAYASDASLATDQLDARLKMETVIDTLLSYL